MPHEEIRKRSLSRTAWISLLCTALLLVAGIGSVFAYVIIDGSKPENQIVETFVPGQVEVEVTHAKDEENGIHTFTVTNVGNVPAYIRLAIVCNWVDKETGNVHWEAPNMSFFNSTSGNDGDHEWAPGSDGYHYFVMPVPGKSTVGTVFTVLDPTMHPKVEGGTAKADVAPEGYSFSVTVLAEGIQAVGETDTAVPAINDAWGTTVVTNIKNNGELTITRKSP